MLNIEYLKQFHQIKDMADIISDIEKLDRLVSQNDWYAVEQHLRTISQKRFLEKAAYNSINQNPPQTIQQSAANCRQFLLILGNEKITEELTKHLGGN